MKKFLLAFIVLILSNGYLKSQCVGACTLYTQNSIPFAPNPTVGTSVSLGDDQVSGALPIGFTFTFYCNAYTNFYISSNGFITFNAGMSSGCCSGGFLPTAGYNPANLVASLWTDLYPPGGGSITYSTSGTAPNRVLTVSWTNIPYYYITGSTTHQIKLFETSNNIEIHSTYASPNYHIKTQGIVNSPGTIGQATPGRNATAFDIPTSDAYQFVMGGGNIATPPGAISGSISVCPGTSYVYSVAALPGATSYSWTLPGGWTGSSSTNTISATPGASGVMSVAAIYTCGTSANTTLNITVNPLPVVTPANTGPYCSGATIFLSTGAASSYTWTGPNGFLSNAQNPSIVNALAVNGGVYTSSVTSAAGCTGSGTTNVVINPLPTPTATSNSPVCIGQPLNLSGAGGTTYTWTGPGGFTSNAQFPSIAVAQASNAGVYTLQVTNNNGCTNSVTTNVVINALPVIVVNNPTVCANTSISLTATGGTAYAWTGPLGYFSNAQNPVITNAQVNMSGNYTVIVTSALGCTNSAVANVTVLTLPTPAITSNTPCVGGTLTLNGSGGGTYSWTGPNGFSSAVQNPSINNVTMPAAGVYSLVVTVGTCTNIVTLPVTINALPTPTATSNSPVCIGQPLNLPEQEVQHIPGRVREDSLQMPSFLQ